MAARSRRIRSSSSPPISRRDRASVARQCLLRGRRDRREDPGRRAARRHRRPSCSPSSAPIQLGRCTSFLEEAGLPKALPAARSRSARRPLPAWSRSNAAGRCRRGATWRWSGARISPARGTHRGHRPALRLHRAQALRGALRMLAGQCAGRVQPGRGRVGALHRADPARAGRGDPHHAARRQGDLTPIFSDEDEAQRRRSATSQFKAPLPRRDHRQAEHSPPMSPTRAGASSPTPSASRSTSASTRRRRW